MPVSQLRLTNWGPYRGEHEVDFADKRFVSIVGPNWGGKSALLDSIAFALYGQTRVEGLPVSDLVTWGESESRIELTISGPTEWKVTRRIAKGKSTVEVSGAEDSRKRDAQTIIDERMGFGRDDFLATAFVQQRDILGLAALKPAELRNLIGSWTDRKEWPELAEKVKKKVEALDKQIEHLRALVRPSESIHSIEGAIEELKLSDLLRRENYEQTRVEGITARIELLSGELGVIAERGKANRAKLPPPEVIETDKRDLLSAQTRSVSIEDRRRSLQVIRASGFDGKCPVSDEVCPVRDQVSEGVKKNRELRERVGTMKSAADEAVRSAKAKVATTESLLKSLIQDQDTYRERRAEVQKLRLSIGEATVPPSDPLFERQLGALEARLKVAKTQDEARENAEKELTGLRRMRASLAFITLGCGRAGVPALESAVDIAYVEQDACRMLQDIGLPFGVSFRQEKELKRWAEQCYVCGDIVDGPECGCGAAREKKRKDELRLVTTFPDGRETPLAAHSGGGQAFSALALRVAGFRLLRERRGANFDVMFFDEIRRAMSTDNARTVSGALSTCFGLGIGQIFDVTHQEQATAEAILEVVPGEKGSSLRWIR